jgi:hypothetical protein
MKAMTRIIKNSKYNIAANLIASISLNKTYIIANESVVFKKYLKNNPKNN